MHDDPATGPPPHVLDQPDDHSALGSIETGRPATIGEDRSPNAWVCSFLRAIDEDGVLGLPVESPDPANRCAALRGPVPQSLRQQELVCLTSGHVNCPRYLRGSIGASEPPKRVSATRTVTPATAGALAVFTLAFVVSVGFVVSNGGLVLSAAGPTPGASGSVLAEVETAAPTAAPTAEPTPVATPLPSSSPTSSSTPTPSSSPSPTPTPTPSPSRTPTPTPTSTPKPTATSTPKPTSNRFALLTPCPNTPSCYIYVIRSGDNLYSIANYFGVSLAKVQAMNPWIKSGLQVGRGLRIPPPTR